MSVFCVSISFDRLNVVATEIKSALSPNARHTKTGNYSNLSLVFKELSILMLNHFLHYCKEVNCQIVTWITLNDDMERQKMK